MIVNPTLVHPSILQLAVVDIQERSGEKIFILVMLNVCTLKTFLQTNRKFKKVSSVAKVNVVRVCQIQLNFNFNKGAFISNYNRMHSFFPFLFYQYGEQNRKSLGPPHLCTLYLVGKIII